MKQTQSLRAALREHMTAMGIGQNELARQLGVSNGCLSKLINAKHLAISDDMARKIKQLIPKLAQDEDRFEWLLFLHRLDVNPSIFPNSVRGTRLKAMADELLDRPSLIITEGDCNELYRIKRLAAVLGALTDLHAITEDTLARLEEVLANAEK